ncbi:MAG: signal peptide peptidase SppA [Gammaproteobacteria bacterium]|nr:MAG: signal peptide peptidase SppA [Gammaproteobacteria bacterium]
MQTKNTQKPNVFKRLFIFLWGFINTSRKIVLNLIFFVFLFAFIGALSNKENLVVVPDSTALVLNLSGDIVEQKHQIDPVDAFINEAFAKNDKQPETLLTDVIRVINKAKNDDRIKILVLNLSGLNRSGLTKLREIGAALSEFKNSNKEIIAIGDGFSQDQYYLASYANKIWMNPQGWLLLQGYGSYPMYFKSALDKLNIKQHIFRVGTYKSAVEPYMRDNMSAAAKEANSLWLNELWDIYKDDVATQRGFGIDNFDETSSDLIAKFEQNDSNFAEYALNNDWVDALKTREQMRKEIIVLVGKNKKGNSFSQINFYDYLSTLAVKPHFTSTIKDKVAVIVAKGTILDGDQDPGTIGGNSTAKLLRKARMDKNVKAVVLRVDSPGGSSYASEIIRQEVELLKQSGKPVVASMGTYGASGGYWISAAADKIFAAPTTITGSIGIFGMMMTFDEALARLGIHSDGVGTTEFAGFSPARPLTDGMAKLFQLNINRGYKDFISLVANNRNMTLEQVDSIAQGRVWTGNKAKELGLIDQLGNLDDAVIEAAKLAKLDKYQTMLIEKEVSPRDAMLQKLFGQASVWLATGQAVTLSPVDLFMHKITAELSKLKAFNDPQGMYSFCESCELE